MFPVTYPGKATQFWLGYLFQYIILQESTRLINLIQIRLIKSEFWLGYLAWYIILQESTRLINLIQIRLISQPAKPASETRNPFLIGLSCLVHISTGVYATD